MEYRTFNKNDTESLRNMIIKVAVEDFNHDDVWLKYYQELDFSCFENSKNKLYIILNDNNPVCCGGYKILDDAKAELCLFYTLKSYQGKKLNSKIYDMVLKDLKSLNIKHLNLISNLDFKDAIKMWQKRGFVEYERHFCSGSYDIKMKKEL
ncbi:MAG: GNAT family N-acetyltransferase [Clostridia bacterium]|nr:GNAT family N-acetyltransferase [Clostridia bacterium]